MTSLETPPSTEKVNPVQIAVPEHLVTIDSESTRDIDDAIGVEQLESGFRVVIAITDPTWLVKIGSTEDENAKLLGETVYVRDKSVRKMLPAAISEFSGSLIEGAGRKVFVFEATLDAALEVQSFRVARQFMTVTNRLSYDDIPRILQGEPSSLQGALKAAASLGHQLLTKRRKRGALALYDLARLIYMDDEGRLIQLARQEEVIGNIIVQEMMILGNSLVAGFMVENEIPGIFRNHKAKPAAPPPDELFATITTWLDSGTMDAEKIESTFAVLLGKASYGATVTGHYALALPFYAHLTSPLRRYADMVNLRQLRAFLKKLPFPYGKDDLQVLADTLNEKAKDRKDKRTNGFKEVVKARAARALERGSLEQLADHEMVQAIKMGIASGSLPDVLVDELVRRFEQAIITDKIADCLLQEGGTNWPDSLKVAFAAWVVETPTKAVNLLTHARQTNFLTDLVITAQGEGTAFDGSVTIERAGSVPVSFAGSANRKRDAEQSAAVKAVLSLIDAALPELIPTGQMVRASGNPKGALLELCQSKQWPMPGYESSGKGPSHAMVFQSKVSVVIDGVVHTETFSGAANKKDAEAQVSALLLAKLKPVQAKKQDAPVRAAVDQSIDANPIGTLQEMAQRMGIGSPGYSFEVLSEVPPKFRATVAVKVPVPGRYTGEATTKQEAKKNAAKKALSASKWS
ncbi:RNB domain-containing ribonuclease [Rhodoferax antarcticus]|uniref:Putative exoribonuclease n=1 Tax=Rhodoferax antarcticus ANT.BR TaxID=1111071 RepID=A0A1Q8Y9P6_9BURK|nr:RNB domain-containing ribonuclease [Rhodoferax antarcticus]OLP04600.1 putative exoribonuclease [Rhodoferax antarcticus ANT.BR]